MARRLGWIGPVIVTVGVIAAAFGAWFMLRARPSPGAVLETIDLGEGATLRVRAEDGGDRSFVELRRGDEVVWQALVPRYAGRPGASGIAWTADVVSVRVVRGDRAELFVIAMRDAKKVGGVHLAPDRGPIKTGGDGPVTMTDHKRTYEVVAGDGWNQLIAVDLGIGRIIWTAELGASAVTAGRLEGGVIWLEQGGQRRRFRVQDGKEDRSLPDGASSL